MINENELNFVNVYNDCEKVKADILKNDLEVIKLTNKITEQEEKIEAIKNMVTSLVTNAKEIYTNDTSRKAAVAGNLASNNDYNNALKEIVALRTSKETLIAMNSDLYKDYQLKNKLLEYITAKTQKGL